MGSRSTHLVGLPDAARSFLEENAIKINPCDHCDRHDGYEHIRHDYTGMFDEEPLFQYTLKDGRTAKEVKQMSVWDSGPVIWLQLEVSDGSTISWCESEMVIYNDHNEENKQEWTRTE